MTLCKNGVVCLKLLIYETQERLFKTIDIWNTRTLFYSTIGHVDSCFSISVHIFCYRLIFSRYLIKHRYQIWCVRRVTVITFIRYAEWLEGQTKHQLYVCAVNIHQSISQIRWMGYCRNEEVIFGWFLQEINVKRLIVYLRNVLFGVCYSCIKYIPS
jgi:hypothetical protein